MRICDARAAPINFWHVNPQEHFSPLDDAHMNDIVERSLAKDSYQSKYRSRYKRQSPGAPRTDPSAQLLAHLATASGSDVKALAGPGMQDTRDGEPSCRELAHSFPVQAVALASSSERAEPVAFYLGSE